MRVGWKQVFAGSGVLAAAIGMLAIASPHGAVAQPAAPQFKYDPTWPKPMAYHIQSVVGMYVDKRDHDNIWVLSRPYMGGGPVVFEFSPQGDLLQHWGGPGYVPNWPIEEHTILTDSAGHVWLAGAGAGDIPLEFTPDGKYIRSLGKPGPPFKGMAIKMQENNQETELLLRGMASAALDEKAHEIFITDGYLNKRVIVLDLDTGKYKREWGAYGKPISEIDNITPMPIKPGEAPRKDFTPAVHCAVIANDGLLYVCDRGGDRVQVFTKAGKFVREIIVAPETSDHGSVGMIAFSPDAEQRYMYVADMTNGTIWIYDHKTDKLLGHFGEKGANPGQFADMLHMMQVDSHGNLYTGEVGKPGKLQKFTLIK